MHSTGTFVILDSVDSTNNYAMGAIRDGVAQHGNAWFTHDQIQGKGRRGRGWESQKSKNIILSITVETRFLSLKQQFPISIVAALAAFDLFSKYAGDETKIKWPNDIFWNDRKAGGILIENIIKGDEWQWAVIGLGVNINQTIFSTDTVFKPVSLKQITGKDFDVIELAKELHENILRRYDELKNNSFEKMLREYNNNLFRSGEKIKLKKGYVVFETVIKEVSLNGKLVTADTIEREFDFEEVELIK